LRHIEGTGAVVTGEDGTVVSHVGTVVDITERKRREAEKEKHELERRALEEQLHQAQKREVMGTLAGGIAHDFNNLLAAIQNFAALIESDRGSGELARQYASRILAGCGRGRDIVSQILTFARTGVQQQEVIDLAAFLDDSEPLLSQAVAESARLSLSGPAEGLWVEGNPGQLLQLITNLCVNAGEAMRATGGEVQVRLTACPRETVARLANKAISPSTHRIGVADPSLSYVLLTVADTGPGMTLQVLRRVFDPFFTTKGRHYGSGLGLSVCQGIVEGHGGFCVVESAPGKGTVFSVLLPAARVRPMTASLKAHAAPVPLKGSGRILMVDDDTDVLESMALGLERQGFEVRSFSDPLAALAALKRNPAEFDLVIADRIMPGLYGVELLERMKAVSPNIRTILCSGHAEEHGETPSAAIEVSLAKPIAAAALGKAVADLLAARTPDLAGTGS